MRTLLSPSINRLLTGILLSTACYPGAQAQAPDAAPFATWLENLRREAALAGVSAQTLDSALNSLEHIPRVIELDRRQPEFTQTFWNYLDTRVTRQRIERGRALLEEHRGLLASVERRYGVPPRYLVAFWGLETNFGSYLGDFPVVGSLATLAYDERRSEFFREQLLDALHIIDEGSVTAANMKGSWAGAMGQMQFMPVTFRHYAVDATGDGRRDLWNSLDDALASGANYLARLGWRPDERWGREVRLPEDFPWEQADIAVTKPIAEWARLGVKRADGAGLPIADMEGAIALPQGHRGPAFLVYHNFDVIMQWNRSINYAIAVGHLADRFAGLPEIANGRDVDNKPMTWDQSLALQRRLNELGFNAGEPDGIPGSQTKAAIRAFQREAGLPQDGHPSGALLEQLGRFER
jgi:membrane-bound lytic murein transglycosylase B